MAPSGLGCLGGSSLGEWAEKEEMPWSLASLKGQNPAPGCSPSTGAPPDARALEMSGSV